MSLTIRKTRAAAKAHTTDAALNLPVARGLAQSNAAKGQASTKKHPPERTLLHLRAHLRTKVDRTLHADRRLQHEQQQAERHAEMVRPRQRSLGCGTARPDETDQKLRRAVCHVRARCARVCFRRPHRESSLRHCPESENH